MGLYVTGAVTSGGVTSLFVATFLQVEEVNAVNKEIMIRYLAMFTLLIVRVLD